jgi:hypothetical protein
VSVQMKWTVDELIEQALIFAIQDREGFYDCSHNGDEHGDQAKALAKAMRKYHAKRYKKDHITPMEREMSQAKTVSIFDLKDSK